MKSRKSQVSAQILIIGIGNEYRGDDAVGLIVARKLRELHQPGIEVKLESGEGVYLMEAWKGYKNVIVVDAVSSGAKPGTIFKFEADKETLPAKFFHYSTHAFSLVEAIELARTMNTLPPRLLVYGIEGVNFAAGVDISPIMKESASQVTEQVIGDFKVSKPIKKQ